MVEKILTELLIFRIFKAAYFDLNIYYGFDPFQQLYEAYGRAGIFVANGMIKKPLDMIGFIDSAFFLAPMLQEDNQLTPRHFLFNQ